MLLYRLDAPARFPKEFDALQKLEGRIDEGAMIRMNAAAELEGQSFAQAAALFFGEETGKRRSFLDVLFGPDFWRLTGEHLLLVFASLAASVAAACRSASSRRSCRAPRSRCSPRSASSRPSRRSRCWRS